MRIHVTYTGGTIGMIETPHGLAPGADMRGWLDHVLEGTQVTREVVEAAAKEEIIAELQKAAKNADRIYLATHPTPRPRTGRPSSTTCGQTATMPTPSWSCTAPTR